MGKKTKYKNEYKVQGEPEDVARKIAKAINADSESHELSYLKATLRLEGHSKE